MTEITRDISQLPMPNGFDPSRIARFLTQFGHSGHIGTRYLAHGEDWVDLAFDWREDLVGDPESGVLASSAIISLMDMACSLAIWTKLGEFRPQVTMDLRVDYLRPSPKGERVFGRGICYHMTHSIGFVRGVAHNGDIDAPLAYVTGTFIRVGDRVQ
jgi:acyl-coenzyme A thioesterase PaaI-like protein